MSKRQFKSQASSGRIGAGFGGAFGASVFGSTQSSPLSYIQEPPDYSGILDPNLVVAFKSLTKKDATTKAKALEDVLAYVTSPDNEVEDAVLEVWVKQYPRLSIDTARRVRQLAHTVNGSICGACGKRTAKQMPTLVGPWLAGGYDSDRAAAKAAQDALRQVFSTPEKVQTLRKAFQVPILEYCRDAVLRETVQTLSDERSVSKEDAEATHARVIATAISVISSLLDGLSPEEISKQQNLYDEILVNSKLWSFATISDAAVRRYTHRLLRVCLAKQPAAVEQSLSAISTAYLSKGLASDQTTSSLDFVATLQALTVSCSSVWTTAYSDKKSVLVRLKQFLKRGSQAGPSEFWTYAASLLGVVPEKVLPKDYAEASELILAMRDGVQKKDERFNASTAWPAYFTLANVLCAQLPGAYGRKLVEGFVLPVAIQYLRPSQDTADWNISGAKVPSLVSHVAMVKYMPDLMQEEWMKQSDLLIEDIKTSLPEQSKEFEKSQSSVAAAGERFALLERELTRSGCRPPASTSSKILEECISVLKARNGKPYGAAAIIETFLQHNHDLLKDDAQVRTLLSDYLINDLHTMLFGRSRRHLASCLYACVAEPYFDKAFTASLDGIIDADRSPSEKNEVMEALFAHQLPDRALELARTSSKLQGYLESGIASSKPVDDWTPVAELLKSGVASEVTANKLLSGMTASLSLADNPSAALSGLQQLSTIDGAMLRNFSVKPEGENLLSSLIRLEQSPDDDIAEKASKLSEQFTSGADHVTSAHSNFSIVLSNLESVSSRSLPMKSLHDLTSRLLGESRKVREPAQLLPSFRIWQSSLFAVIEPPVPSLAITSLLGGAVHLTQSVSNGDGHIAVARWDNEGLSQALRIAMYVARLTATTSLTDELDKEESAMLLQLLHLTILLAKDNISVAGANKLWRVIDDEMEAEVLDFISQAESFTTRCWLNYNPTSHSDSADFAFVGSVLDTFLQNSHGVGAEAFYSACAYAVATAELWEVHGYSTAQTKNCENSLRTLRASNEVLPVLAYLAGQQLPLASSEDLSRYCNSLVADLTGVGVTEQPQKALQLLVPLNVILRNIPDVGETIATQRVVFLVKPLIVTLESGPDARVGAEILRALAVLLPRMQDMYGEHWASVLAVLVEYWKSASAKLIAVEDRLPLIHASLKLYATLRKLASSEDPNDDLTDAMKDSQTRVRVALIQLLTASREISDESNQPRQIMNELLARLNSQLPDAPLENANELFPLLYTPSSSLQQAAFDLLHRHIPKAQEEVSLNAALEKKTAHLPEELLSLVLEAPTLDALVDASFDRRMPLPLQGYLYSWRLLFDHFQGSSYKVKSDYIEELKDGTYLSGLLDFTFDFLGHSRGKPIDASRFDIVTYTPNIEESAERDVQWLLTHIYYLCLTHLPSLAKAYYLSIKSRQTSLAVESWTAKYISPLIIAASLSSVAEWASTSVKDDPEYGKMSVKVGMKSKEINVSYVVDEQTMAIVVRLPDTYPLGAAKVEGVSRVAVKEERWQSWLRNCQGVITFSNGSVIDGLTAWRKNVTGALKGQTECAICYSIISGDKQLPTKRCPTCKHLFHASCLFKWFKTSNANTCPLCRNAFNFN